MLCWHRACNKVKGVNLGLGSTHPPKLDLNLGGVHHCHMTGIPSSAWALGRRSWDSTFGEGSGFAGNQSP